MTPRRTALVTGSTSGLGLDVALRLARAGFDIVIHGTDSPQAGMAIAGDIERHGKVEAIYVRADFTEPGGAARLIDAAETRFGGIDILVNNAVTRNFFPVQDFPPDAWEKALAVNLSAPFHAVRLVLPRMLERDWGRIVNIGSIYSFIGAKGRIDYVTAKTALLGFTRAVALEVAGTGVSCNAVCPGTLRTPQIEERIADIAARKGQTVEEATREYLLARQPSGRFISSRTVTDLIAFLCGPETADINGAALPVDAGWSIA